MPFARLASFVLASLLACAGAQAATYTYHHVRANYVGGASFTACGAPPCATFTTAMHIEGTFTLVAPLANNLPNTQIGALVTSFSFNDGLTTYDSTDPLVRMVDFQVSTNASGTVTIIELYVERWRTAGPHVANDRLEHLEGGYGSYNRYCNAPGAVPSGVADACFLTSGDASSSYFFSPLPGTTTLVAPFALAAAVNYPAGTQAKAVAAADFNGDGRLDLVVVNQNSVGTGSVSILLAAGAPGNFAAPVNYPVQNQPFWVAVADFNGDGNLDLAVTNVTSNSVSILLGDGSGSFGAATAIATGGAGAVVAGDFNGDGKVDLAVSKRVAGNIAILLGNGDGTFTAGATLPGTGTMTAMRSGDFNGDGKIDLAAIDANNSFLHVYLGDGAGAFSQSAFVATGALPADIAVGDFNGDGRADIATANGNNSVSLFLGNGNGTFTAGASLSASTSPRGIAVGDFDRDGKLDLVVTLGVSNRIDVFRGNGDGTFAAPAPAATGAGPFLVAVADLDGDGRPDIAVANMGADNVSIFLNTTSVLPNPPTAPIATAGDAQISVAFTPPTDPASLPILDYTADCGGITAVGTSSPIVVTGLANGVAYTCTVTARNATGNSTASAPSNSVTPRFVTSLGLATSASPVLVGVPVTFTATITGGTPTGTVNFKDGGTTIAGCGAVALAAGSAQCVASFVTGGTKLVTADYSGDAAHAPSTGVLPGGQVITAAQGSFTGPTATGSGSATVSFTGGGATCSFAPQGNGAMQSAFFIPLSGHPKSPPGGSAPAGVIFPQGLLDFVLINCTPGATMTFTVTYPSAISPASSYWKYGPTTATPAAHWYTLPATIVGNVVTFSITDGGLGDDDLAANGTVVDQGGPGFPGGGERQVPTLTEWMLALLALLVMTAGAAVIPCSAARSRR